MQAAEQFRRALQMFAMDLNEEKALMVASVYDPWRVGKDYIMGEFLTYGVNSVGDPQLYKVLQPHTSQMDWTPNGAGSLYAAIGLNDRGYPRWSQPAGSHDAYGKGDVVDYQGILYESVMDANTYSPEQYPAGWKIYVESR